MKTQFDVVGVGNALVDVLCHVDEKFLTINGVQKGVMQLIDSKRAVKLTERVVVSEQACGGSTANTIASLAALGVKAGYIGKVKDDRFGKVFAEEYERQGVTFTSPLADCQQPYETGRCLVMVTPDGERSLNTYLGAAEFLTWEDFSVEMLESANWLYLEGYRFDGEKGQDAFHQSVRTSRSAGGQVALTSSDPFCVSRHREAFLALIEAGVNLLFCNRAELLSLYQTVSLEEALSLASRKVGVVACTLSEDGAVIGAGSQRISVPSRPARLVDATGAGDLFAAGFLFGMIRGKSLEVAAHMGCACAAEVISQLGARPVSDIRQLLQKFD